MSKLTKALTAAAGNAGGTLGYVEDVFSTYLYTGTGAAGQNIVNGIDLSTEGGLVWCKSRSTSDNNCLYDTERGAGAVLRSNTTAAQQINTGTALSFNTNGFFTGANYAGSENDTGQSIASWTFRKAEKFFDVVTYTGNGVAGREIAHNLGAVPGMIIVKQYQAGEARPWSIYHRGIDASAPEDYRISFTTGARADDSGQWNDTAPTDSVFTLGTSTYVNNPGESYVAYLFASDAGGFGDDGSENIIKCGSYTGNGSTQEINLGWEAQFVIIKSSSNADNWDMFDVMRGMTVGGNDESLDANRSNPSVTDTDFLEPYANGFRLTSGNVATNYSSRDYIYIAIRRPMKTPESGTEVFMADTRASSGGTLAEFISGFPVDMYLRYLLSASFENRAHTRLLGETKLITNTTAAEVADTTVSFDSNVGAGPSGESANTSVFAHMFKRATGFFDMVAYTGNGSEGYQVNHNLGVIPELIIIKRRNNASAVGWFVGTEFSATNFTQAKLNLNNAASNSLAYTTSSIFKAQPTTTNFTLGNYQDVNNSSGDTYIAYLFATLAGVSKVGSYTGTGSDLNVDCGFSAGARFILIKRTDSTGDWYVYDSVRGIVAGNDPYLLLNSTAAEVTNTDYIDPLSSGFTVTSSAPAALNASGGTYIFLAIA